MTDQDRESGHATGERLVAAITNLDEVWLMRNSALAEDDATLPLVVRNFIADVRAIAGDTKHG